LTNFNPDAKIIKNFVPNNTEKIFDLLKKIKVFDPDFELLILEKIPELSDEKLAEINSLLLEALDWQKKFLERGLVNKQVAVSSADKQKIEDIKNFIVKL